MARHMGIANESAWGTPETTMDVFLEALSEGIQDEPAFEEIKTIRSDATRQIVETKHVIRGPFEAVGNYQDLPWLLWAIIGDVDTTGAGPYTHTIPGSTGVATRPPLTVEVQRDSTALTWRYAGCVLTELGINVSVDQSMRVRGAVLGKSEGTGLDDTAVFPDLDVILPKQVTITIDAGSLDVASFSLNITRPADEPNTLGSVDLAVQPQATDVIGVTGEFEVLFTGLTEYNKFVSRADTDFAVVMDTGGDEIITLNMNKVRLTQGTPHVEGRERLRATFSYSSFFDTTATSNLQAVCVNDQATIP